MTGVWLVLRPPWRQGLLLSQRLSPQSPSTSRSTCTKSYFSKTCDLFLKSGMHVGKNAHDMKGCTVDTESYSPSCLPCPSCSSQSLLCFNEETGLSVETRTTCHFSSPPKQSFPVQADLILSCCANTTVWTD